MNERDPKIPWHEMKPNHFQVEEEEYLARLEKRIHEGIGYSRFWFYKHDWEIKKFSSRSIPKPPTDSPAVFAKAQKRARTYKVALKQK